MTGARHGLAWRPAGMRATPRLRLVELFLLALAAGVALVAAAPRPLQLSGTLDLVDLSPTLWLIGLFAVLHVVLVLRGRRTDQLILPVLLVLTGLSLALNQRLAPDLAARQWRWLLLGSAITGLVVVVPYELRLLKRYRYTWALGGAALVALTLVFGRSAPGGGPRLWLGVGPMTFQPSEVLKVLVVVFLAGYLDDRRELLAQASTRLGPLRLPPLPYLAPLGIMLGLSLALLAAQRDLGAALLLFTIALGLLYLASGRADYVLLGLGAFLAGAWVLFRWLPIVAARVAVWRDPWSDPQGAGYQLVRGLMALAAGGVTGTGLGFGAPTTIPVVHSDFIYAAVAEELGLAGATALLALYALLVLRGFRIALRASDPFARLLAAGLTFAVAVQVFIIVGGVVRLIPLTGITLPFLSYGGTSMLVSCAVAGMLLRVSEDVT